MTVYGKSFIVIDNVMIIDKELKYQSFKVNILR